MANVPILPAVSALTGKIDPQLKRQKKRTCEPNGRRRARDVIGPAAAVAAIVVIGILRLGPGVSSSPFHRDEARWIGNSALLDEWRDPFGPRWQDEGYFNRYGTIDESNRRRSQPPLAMYVLGIGLLLQGEGLQKTGYWIMDRDADWNAAQGNLPSDSELQAARRVNVALAVATAVLIFLIGKSMLGMTGGTIAAMTYVIHPLVLMTSTRAWSDPTLVFCVALAGLAALQFGKRPTFSRAILLGICLGLGVAAKLSPLVIAAGLGALAVLPIAAAILGRNGMREALRAAAKLLLVPASAALTFVALYPYLWTDPVEHTRRLFDFRSRSFDLQATAFPPARVVDTPDALARIGIHLSERASAASYLSDPLTRWFGLPSVSWAAETDLMLALAGLPLLIAVLACRAFPLRDVMPLLVLGGQAALIVASFRLDYSRYLLPLMPLLSIAAAATVVILGSCLISLVNSSGIILRRPSQSMLKEPPATEPG